MTSCFDPSTASIHERFVPSKGHRCSKIDRQSGTERQSMRIGQIANAPEGAKAAGFIRRKPPQKHCGVRPPVPAAVANPTSGAGDGAHRFLELGNRFGRSYLLARITSDTDGIGRHVREARSARIRHIPLRSEHHHAGMAETAVISLRRRRVPQTSSHCASGTLTGVTVGRSKTDAGLPRILLNGGAVWAFAHLLERAQSLGATEQDHFLMLHFRYRQTKAKKRGTGYDPNGIKKRGARRGARWSALHRKMGPTTFLAD